MGWILLYLVLGVVFSYIFIYSGKYEIIRIDGSKINNLWKARKATFIALSWPYVIVKGLIDSNR
jgi:hypothetical protein